MEYHNNQVLKLRWYKSINSDTNDEHREVSNTNIKMKDIKENINITRIISMKKRLELAYTI